MVAAVHNRSYIVESKCWRCSSVNISFVNKEDLLGWMNGDGPIEKILGYLSADERELLISNTCGSCFDSLFDALDIDD